jgi:3-isopropylmalate/(R)-2-methylmalate dehydratase small subunit
MTSFSVVTSRAVSLPLDDIDTDQIIPARFLTATTREGMGRHLFSDLKKREGFPLNSPDARGAAILIAGGNFGCGSSREHASWALADFGFRAVVSSSFADIFRSNAMKNGILPVAVDAATLGALHSLVVNAPDTQVTIDLERQSISWPGGSQEFAIDAFARQCLLHGVDELGYLLRHEGNITMFEAHRARGGAS